LGSSGVAVIETFPAEMKTVAEAGHEIGIHGYLHENPIAMTREQEMAVFDKCTDLVNWLMPSRERRALAPECSCTPAGTGHRLSQHNNCLKRLRTAKVLADPITIAPDR
jgi:hypothetical protein